MRHLRIILSAACIVLGLVPAAQAQVMAVKVTSQLVELRWTAQTGAGWYEVLRNGRTIGTFPRPGLIDRSVEPAHSYTYRIRPHAAGSGKAGALGVPVPVTTRSGAGCVNFASSSAGSDTNDGSADHPVRTIQRLVNITAPGEVGCARGSFVGDVTFHHGGTASRPVVIRSAAGTRALVRGRLWVPDGSPYVIVQDLNLDGRNLDGGELPSPTVEGDHAMFLHNDITNHRHHICAILGSLHGFGAARDVTFDANRIHDCGRRPTNNEHHGIYLENALSTRITNNVFFQNQSRGIQLYPNAQSSVIARNVIVANGEGVIFSGNLGHASSNNRVVDNLVSNSRTRYDIEYWWPAGNPIGTGNVAARNCVWGGHDGTIIDHPIGFRALDNLIARPRFRDLAHGDLRAASGSACRWYQSPVAPLRPLA